MGKLQKKKTLASYYGIPERSLNTFLQTPLHTPPRLASDYTVTFCWSLADLYMSLYSVSQQMDVRIVRKNTAKVEHWPQKALGSGFVSIIHYESDPPPHPRILTLTVAVQGPGRSRLTPLRLYHFQENYSNCLVGILSNFKEEGKYYLA